MKKPIGKRLMEFLVFIAIVGMIFLLSAINIKLLTFLNWIKSTIPIIDQIIITIAGISYAVGSISIILWYNTSWNKDLLDTKKDFKLKILGNIILKSIFVLLDGFHVYIYNNSHIDDLASWVSPVFAVQTILILFFIGNVVEDIITKNINE